jgi:predicted transcriptional regulator/transcriptional regulator with XRE-family HTH domain
MASAAKLGTKVRTLRRKHGMSQVDLANALAISSSYLNLIEHDQRTLTAPLLVKVAQIFQVDLDTFIEEGEAQRVADLQEVFGDPLFEEHPLMTSDVRELAGNQAVSRALVALYHAYKSSVESTRALSSKVYDGRDFAGIDPAHLPSEEVSDVIQMNMNYFPELEEEADRLAAKWQFETDASLKTLTNYLAEAHGIHVVILPPSADRTAVRRFDPNLRRIALSERLSIPARRFQVAHQIALLTAGGVIDSILSRSHLTTPESNTLGRVALANYFAGALLLPYDRFFSAAEELRYDIDLLGNRFGVSFEQVCHRLTTLRRQGSVGVPFHFVRVDLAGNISKRFSGTGIRFSRFSGSCPRWDVHAAFLTPGRIRTQVSKMPDGTAYFCVARTVQKHLGGYASGDAVMAVGIGCPVKDARNLVYADGIDLDNLDAAVPIGTTCRLCPRMDCDQRAFPPIQHRMTIDENVRGVSFYAPAAAQPSVETKIEVKPARRRRATT